MDSFHVLRSANDEVASFLAQIWRFSDVLMNWTGSGTICLGVSSCRRYSPEWMMPPPLPRTSRIKPRFGNADTNRTNSAMSCSGATLNERIRT